MNPNKRKRLLKAGTGILLTCIILVILLLGIEPYFKLVTPVKETFTELYFEDHTHLPKNVFRGIPFDLSFTVRNLENKDMSYQVRVTSSDEADPPRIFSLLESDIFIPKSKAKTFPLRLTLPIEASKREKITIELTNISESIYFRTYVATPSASQWMELRQ